MMHKIVLACCLLLLCSCDNHDFYFSEKEQAFYVSQMLIFSIEPLDSLGKSYSYNFVLRTPKSSKEVDTICLRKRISKKFEVKETSYYMQEFRCDPSLIRLSPNTQYVVKHYGMGARVNIIKYYHTDSLGNLHYDERATKDAEKLYLSSRCSE